MDSDVYVGGRLNRIPYILFIPERMLSGSIQLGEDWWGGEFIELIQKLKNKEITNENIRFL